MPCTKAIEPHRARETIAPSAAFNTDLVRLILGINWSSIEQIRRILNPKRPLPDHRADCSRALRKSAHTAYCGRAISADPSILVVSASANAGGLIHPVDLFPYSVMRRSKYDRQIGPTLNPMSTKGNIRRRRDRLHGLGSDIQSDRYDVRKHS